MPSKFLNISTDNTLGGNLPSDVVVSSQKAIKEYVDSHGGGGSASADGITINTNSSNELQAIGLINKNSASGSSNPIYDWVGTLQEYQDQTVATSHPDWICCITDDISGGESVYTKEEVDEGFLATNKITNCITEIPQDIKLELNNGTLTLKAGSKVSVPNGAGVFDAVTTQNDISLTVTWAANTKRLLFVRNNATALEEREFSFSGGVAPTSIQYSVWYDTTNNTIKYTSDSGSTWSSNCSFPIALVSNTNNVTTSIDQVFNGFGYIGSTVFALPGVKGLIPNGRNADGTLKSIEFTTANVLTYTGSWATRELTPIVIKSDELSIGNTYSTQNGYRYIEDKNILYINNTNLTGYAYCGDFSFSSNKINFCKFNVPFHALNWNDKETIAGWSMPSSRYIDLTIGAHSSSYLAPANGWFAIYGYAGSNALLWLKNTTNQIMQSSASYGSSSKGGVCIPCKKGDSVQIGYYGGVLDYVRFVYAEGEN